MVYKRIRDLREDRDLTQKQLGEVLNIAQRTYSNYEIGGRTMSPEILSKIADFHNTSVDYLLERTNTKEPYPKKGR